MNKRFFLYLFEITLLSTAPSFAADKPLILDKCDKLQAQPVFNTLKTGDGYLVTGDGGVCYKGNVDISGYNRIRMTVCNQDKENYLLLHCLLSDSQGLNLEGCQVFKPSVKTRHDTQIQVRIKPGETRDVIFNLPPDVLHPEVQERFTESLNLRNGPYSNILRMYHYTADLKDIRTIRIVSGFVKDDAKWTVSGIKLLPGKRVAPPVMKLTKDEYFPMVDKYGQFRHKEWPGKIHTDKDLKKSLEQEDKDLAAHPGPADRSRFGGWKSGPRYEATGNFRVQKIDGKWWMIDPDGYLFWAHGVVRVTPSSAVTPLDNRHDFFQWLPTEKSDPFYEFYSTNDELLGPYYVARGQKETYDFSRANIYRKYGEDYYNKYAERCHQRLKSWGLNLIANSSDRAICMMDKTPYNERVDLGAPVKGFPQWPEFKGSTLWCWWNFIDPFDPVFETCVRAHLLEKADQLKDPWCIGMFVDNEIQWGDLYHFGKLTAKSAPDFAAKTVFMYELLSKYGSIEALNKSWGTEFSDWNAFLENREDVPEAANTDCGNMSELLADQYFKTVRKVFKEIAPNKLYLGCRFCRAPDFVVRTGALYCDVMSWNLYSYDMKGFKLVDEIDKPVMMGEFHFGSLDGGLSHPGLKYTNNMEDKGVAYENYVRSALENPYVIGTNWHQFSDQATTGRFDGECYQVGFTDCCDTPYPEMVRHLRAIGDNMYQIRLDANVEPGYYEVSTSDAGAAADYRHTTSEQLIERYYEPLRQRFPEYITRKCLGTDASGKYKIWCYTFAPKEYKHTIYIQAGVHGANEMESYWGTAMMMNLIADPEKGTPRDKRLDYIRNNVRLIVVPVVNVWSASERPVREPELPFHYKRMYSRNADGINLNRDWVKSAGKETRIIQEYLNSIKDELDFFFDNHTDPEGIPGWGAYLLIVQHQVPNDLRDKMIALNNHLYQKNVNGKVFYNGKTLLKAYMGSELKYPASSAAWRNRTDDNYATHNDTEFLCGSFHAGINNTYGIPAATLEHGARKFGNEGSEIEMQRAVELYLNHLLLVINYLQNEK